MSNTKVDLDELDKLHDKASPGKWCVNYGNRIYVAGRSYRDPPLVYDMKPDDAAYIVGLHNSYEELRRQARRFDDMIEFWDTYADKDEHIITAKEELLDKPHKALIYLTDAYRENAKLAERIRELEGSQDNT